MRSPNAGIGGRTQQAGTLMAAAVMPITFQPTLMPRSRLDQALITGISTSLNYAFAALIQGEVAEVGHLDLALGVLVDRQGVDHPHGVAFAQPLQFVDDLAVEVGVVEPEYQQLHGPDGHGVSLLVTA